MIETHCHLDYLKNQSIDVLLEESTKAGITHIITISVSPDNILLVRELSKIDQRIYFTQGIHPHDAQFYQPIISDYIKEASSHPKMVAVGEIGLDFHYNNSPKEKQIEVFETQLELATQLDLPVVIHSREAEDETIAALKNYPNVRGVIHSFTSSIELAEFALENDFYLGFNGIITFKNAQNVRDIVHITPVDKILTETDSPFLTPNPHRGKENAPFYLPHIVQKLAELKNVNLDKLITQTRNNAFTLFDKLMNH